MMTPTQRRLDIALFLRTRLAQAQRKFPVRRIHLSPDIFRTLKARGDGELFCGVPVFMDVGLPQFEFRFLESHVCPSIGKEVLLKAQ